MKGRRDGSGAIWRVWLGRMRRATRPEVSVSGQKQPALSERPTGAAELIITVVVSRARKAVKGTAQPDDRGKTAI